MRGRTRDKQVHWPSDFSRRVETRWGDRTDRALSHHERRGASMKAERWQHVKQLMEEAIAIAPDDRSLFLESACHGDAEIRSEIDSLLAAHDDAGTAFLDRKSV